MDPEMMKVIAKKGTYVRDERMGQDRQLQREMPENW